MVDTFLTINGILHTATISGLVDGNNYIYYIKCADVLGNENTDDFIITFSIASPEPPPLPESSPSPMPSQPLIVINEIAWMGTIVSANNEWIELFNPGDQAVDLSGWKLQSADSIPTIQLSQLIEPHGFYLLERTDDDSVPSIAADQIYTGALSNSGEQIYLYDTSGNIIDEVNCATGWFAGDNTNNQTMQRKDPLSAGNNPDNWQTSQDPGGTPRF